MTANDFDRVRKFLVRRHREPCADQDERAFVAEKPESGAPFFSMLEKDGGTFIGNIEFMDRKGDPAVLGITITAAKQDAGYGSEWIRRFLDYGFQEFGLRRAFLRVYPENGPFTCINRAASAHTDEPGRISIWSCGQHSGKEHSYDF